MAYCTNCGTEETEGQQFCPVCGATSAAAHVAVSSARVLVGTAPDPPRQARWSVLARPLLVVPLAAVLFALEVASFFVVVAAWFGALVTGRVPDGPQRFLTNVLRAYANALFYGLFLTPRWPGVVFRPRPEEQVSVAVDHVGLRRSAVFFRFLLGYPASLVGSLLYVGAAPLWLVMWLWGVVAGREARALHQAVALIARYQVRLIAYSALLTPTQPFRGLFGDSDGASGATGTTLGEPGAAASVAAPSRQSAALVTRWLVGRPAKVLVVVCLLVGAPSYVVLSNADSRWARTLVARPLVSHTHSAVLADVRTFLTAVSGCASIDRRRCTASAAASADARLREESDLLAGNALIPSDALTSARRYEGALSRLDDVVRRIEDAASASAQQRAIAFDLPSARSRFNTDYKKLEALLTW